MAPNNHDELANKESRGTAKDSTTVLPEGTVESRGTGTKSRDLSAEIESFVKGEAKFGAKAEIRSYFTVWMFITRFPSPTWVDLHPGFLMRGMCYFPIAGAVVGIFVATFYDMASVVMGLPLSVSAAACTAASLWITGCFHEDGLADSADGIGGGWTHAQILRIMSDSRLGTYGGAVLALHMIAIIHLLTGLGVSRYSLASCEGAGPALIVAHALSRLTSPIMIRTRDYVYEFGPKTEYYHFMVRARDLCTTPRVIFSTLACISLSSIAYGLFSLVLVAAVYCMAFFAGRYGEFILGGVMGDFLGATICVTQHVVLTLILMRQTHDYNKPLTYLFQVISSDIRFAVLMRFVTLVFVTFLWCKCVGYPYIIVHDSATEANENQDKNGNDNINKKELDKNEFNSDCRKEAFSFPDGASFDQRYKLAQDYLDSLAKPVGSLGTLEEWAARLAAIQCTSTPVVDKAVCIIFASDHGVAAPLDKNGEQCSAYPQSVTRSVLHCLRDELSGASVLAKSNNVIVQVVDVGVISENNDELEKSSSSSLPSDSLVRISPHKLKHGTKNFCIGPAMSTEEVTQCIKAGRDAFSDILVSTAANVVALGEIGIGNTTSSSALVAALTGADVQSVCDGGATMSRLPDQEVIDKKILIVKKALALHGVNTAGDSKSVIETIREVGGAEIAAMVGAILKAYEYDIPMLIDGFIVSAAALAAVRIKPQICNILFFTTRSSERGHGVVFDAIKKIAEENNLPLPSSPALSMGLRLGEGTGAILSVPLIRSASALFTGMATLQQCLENDS